MGRGSDRGEEPLSTSAVDRVAGEMGIKIKFLESRVPRNR